MGSSAGKHIPLRDVAGMLRCGANYVRLVGLKNVCHQSLVIAALKEDIGDFDISIAAYPEKCTLK